MGSEKQHETCVSHGNIIMAKVGGEENLVTVIYTGDPRSSSFKLAGKRAGVAAESRDGKKEVARSEERRDGRKR